MTEVQPKRKKRRSSGNDVAMRDQAVAIIRRPETGVELEMEDWEVAPGRIKDESCSDSEFSVVCKAQLTYQTSPIPTRTSPVVNPSPFQRTSASTSWF
jgi:hypothetical protein